jgi:hypothetical protein
MEKTRRKVTGRRRLARARLRKKIGAGPVEVGERKWSCEDLYKR